MGKTKVSLHTGDGEKVFEGTTEEFENLSDKVIKASRSRWGIGHNSDSDSHFSQGKLRAFVQRIERLEEDKRDVQDDIKLVYAEAKSTGFDPKSIRQLVRDRRLSDQERIERDELLELYRSAIGDFVTTPLGTAGQSRFTNNTAPDEQEEAGDA